MTSLELPDYCRPPERIRERFRTIRERPVVLSVEASARCSPAAKGRSPP